MIVFNLSVLTYHVVENVSQYFICCKIKVEKVASENSIVLQLEIPQYCKSPLQA